MKGIIPAVTRCPCCGGERFEQTLYGGTAVVLAVRVFCPVCEAPPCSGCVWYRRGIPTATCAYPEVAAPALAHARPFRPACIWERLPSGRCGPAAYRFKPKPPRRSIWARLFRRPARC